MDREEKNMAKKKSGSSKGGSGDNISSSVSISGSSNVVAAVGKGNRATTGSPSNESSELNKWRKVMESKINALKDLPAEDKSTLNQQVEQIAREAEKGPQADPNRIERLFNTISAMAPDIFDVAVATMANPLAGIGLVVKKIGEKAQVQKG
jgi:hypothetical protein